LHFDYKVCNKGKETKYDLHGNKIHLQRTQEMSNCTGAGISGILTLKIPSVEEQTGLLKKGFTFIISVHVKTKLAQLVSTFRSLKMRLSFFVTRKQSFLDLGTSVMYL